jgi:ArsR family transcriptional regulator, arsenate/arsenite/antimonite-responsive transcriptional repressor
LSRRSRLRETRQRRYSGPFAGDGIQRRTDRSLAALGQPSRLEIFRLLVRNESKGLSAGAIAEAIGCPHNTFSTHIAILARAGLVRGARGGRTITYRADLTGIRALIAFLVTDCCDGHPELCKGLTGIAAEASCGCPPAPSRKKQRR